MKVAARAGVYALSEGEKLNPEGIIRLGIFAVVIGIEYFNARSVAEPVIKGVFAFHYLLRMRVNEKTAVRHDCVDQFAKARPRKGGVHKMPFNAARKGVFGDWDDFGLALPDAVNIGGAHSPNLELIFSANPDFVIASASTSSNVEMKETLEAAGITVAYFDVDNFSDYLAMLDICTDITERKDLYECNGLAIQSQIEDIKQAIEERALPEEQRTVLLLRAHSSSVKAKGSKGTILGEMLADLGCINIADSDTSLLETLSVESIIRQEPYRIFVVSMGNDTEKAIDNLNQMMNENPAWGTLDAVAEGRLHLMERKLFNIKPNADWAESYEKLSEILLTE